MAITLLLAILAMLSLLDGCVPPDPCAVGVFVNSAVFCHVRVKDSDD